MSDSFVYVARLEKGDEVEIRRILDHAPVDAFAEHGIRQFSSYVGSGFCVLQFEMPEGDFQADFEAFANDPRVNAFSRELAGHLIEGQEIAQHFTPADDRHQVDPAAGQAVTSAQLPLASLVNRWPERQGSADSA